MRATKDNRLLNPVYTSYLQVDSSHFSCGVMCRLTKLPFNCFNKVPQPDKEHFSHRSNVAVLISTTQLKFISARVFFSFFFEKIKLPNQV